MRRHYVWFLLAVSVLFNVFFLAGYSKALAQVEQIDNGSTTQGVASVLELDDAQRAVFEQLQTGMADETRSMRDAMAMTRQNLIDELERDEPDLEKVRSTVQQIGVLQHQHRAASLERFSMFMSCLTEDQCRKLGQRMGEPRRGDHWRRRLLERFDKNGNGELDPDERAEAQAFHEARRREHETQRRRFDTDGDGLLDEQEREALRAWMRSNGRGRGGRNGQGRPGPGPR